jgi:uncharacterized protein (TIGR00255 family)
MRSMTGYGRGEAGRGGFKFTVELNSVNRKQSDIAMTLPKELIELEPRIRDEINTRLTRGRVNVVVAYHRGAGRPEEQVALDEGLARAYLRAIQRLGRELKLEENVTLDTLLRAPGVLRLAETEVNPEVVWPEVEGALRKALDQLVKMREKEGRFLAKDLGTRLDVLAQGIGEIRTQAPEAVKRYREQLQARIKEAGLEVPVNDDRLAKEVVIFADRCDISEELTRLDSHLVQFREQLRSADAVGRSLDFLSQEMNRELNTIGSKANAAGVSQWVVKLKAELEKIREQVQNIE